MSAPKILIGKLVSETRIGVIGVVCRRTLLVRRLRAREILLLVLIGILALGVLGPIKIVVISKITSPLAASIRNRALMTLDWRPEVVVRLLAPLILEDWLGEGGGRGRVDTCVASSIVAVVVVSSGSRKVQMKAVVRIHGAGIKVRAAWSQDRASSRRSSRMCLTLGARDNPIFQIQILQHTGVSGKWLPVTECHVLDLDNRCPGGKEDLSVR